jgi:hypothetical protein
MTSESYVKATKNRMVKIWPTNGMGIGTQYFNSISEPIDVLRHYIIGYLHHRDNK